MPANDPILVSIGLIERMGHFLIRKRPDLPGSPMPGLWEFPGGKCEGGETPENAVVRECLEETGLSVSVDRLRLAITHHYSHGHVKLNYFDCRLVDSAAEPSAGSGFVWMAGRELPDLEFPAANEPILKELAGLLPSDTSAT